VGLELALGSLIKLLLLAKAQVLMPDSLLITNHQMLQEAYMVFPVMLDSANAKMNV
jgi:hypothetical protein